MSNKKILLRIVSNSLIEDQQLNNIVKDIQKNVNLQPNNTIAEIIKYFETAKKDGNLKNDVANLEYFKSIDI